MDPIREVKEALAARARTTSLDDLRRQGRKSVQVIRPDQIAATVQESVEKALAGSDLLSPDDVQRLVERGQREFRGIIAEREAQIAQFHDTARELEQVKSDRVRLQALLENAADERNKLRQRNEELEEFAAETRLRDASSERGAEVISRLTAELEQLKAEMQATSSAQSTEAVGQGQDVSAAIEKLAGTLNDRLESFGRKMGISSAVEATEVNFDELFDREGDAEVESNMDSVHVKKTTEGGIEANLERLRKLKGDG